MVAQSTSYGNWRFQPADENLFLYSIDGSGIENTYEIPDFTIIIAKNKGGDMKIRLDNTVLYRYDYSENDYNYVSVDIIVDNGDMLSYDGQVYPVSNNDNETRVYLSNIEGGTRLTDIIQAMKNGSELFVRTTGAKSPIVFKYSLSGFNSGFEKLFDSWESCCKEIKNPFNSKNPFDQY